MDNLNTDEQIIKKWFKRIKPLYVVSFFLVVCLVFIAWQFGVKKWEAKIYARGLEAGKLEVNTLVVQQLLTNGRIGINLPMKDGQYNLDGTLTTIFLIPQINNGTTTQ